MQGADPAFQPRVKPKMYVGTFRPRTTRTVLCAGTHFKVGLSSFANKNFLTDVGTIPSLTLFLSILISMCVLV